VEDRPGVSSLSSDYLADGAVLHHPATCPVATYHPGAAWRSDVSLEMWVDQEKDPVSIRLEGTLDPSTVRRVVSLVRELIRDGARRFEFESSYAMTDVSSTAMLDKLQGLYEGCGASFTWIPANPAK
jgi:hypothetical protein